MEQPQGVAQGLGFVVVDPRLSAPRGEQYTNAFVEIQQRVAASGGPDSEYGDWFDGESEEAVGAAQRAEATISEDNVGYKLLQKMGWKGKGLGRNEDGIVEPVKAGVEAGVRLGLGKQEEDNLYTNAESIQRKKLETEIQANEDEERKERREMQAERDLRIKLEVAEIKKTFYCEVCHKQYKTAMEMETHLSSYDHHHKKRLAEMKAMTNQRNRSDREKKEKKKADKEMAKLQAQFERAAAQKGLPLASTTTPPAPAPPLPPALQQPAAPPLPPAHPAPPVPAAPAAPAVPAAPLPPTLAPPAAPTPPPATPPQPYPMPPAPAPAYTGMPAAPYHQPAYATYHYPSYPAPHTQHTAAWTQTSTQTPYYYGAPPLQSSPPLPPQPAPPAAVHAPPPPPPSPPPAPSGAPPSPPPPPAPIAIQQPSAAGAASAAASMGISFGIGKASSGRGAIGGRGIGAKRQAATVAAAPARPHKTGAAPAAGFGLSDSDDDAA